MYIDVNKNVVRAIPGFWVHFNMGNLQYTATVWVCRCLSSDICPEDMCDPIELFHEMSRDHPFSWGHYAVYLTWLNHHFSPTRGLTVFGYLKQHHPDKMYSFWYLAAQYYGYWLCQSLRTWVTG